MPHGEPLPQIIATKFYAAIDQRNGIGMSTINSYTNNITHEVQIGPSCSLDVCVLLESKKSKSRQSQFDAVNDSTWTIWCINVVVLLPGVSLMSLMRQNWVAPTAKNGMTKIILDVDRRIGEGNNKYGSKGRTKCDECRRRKIQASSTKEPC